MEYIFVFRIEWKLYVIVSDSECDFKINLNYAVLLQNVNKKTLFIKKNCLLFVIQFTHTHLKTRDWLILTLQFNVKYNHCAIFKLFIHTRNTKMNVICIYLLYVHIIGHNRNKSIWIFCATFIVCELLFKNWLIIKHNTHAKLVIMTVEFRQWDVFSAFQTRHVAGKSVARGNGQNLRYFFEIIAIKK